MDKLKRGDTLPSNIKEIGKTTYRSMMLEGEEIEFSNGFTDLHMKRYKNITDGKGYRMSESIKAINIVHEIRNAHPIGKIGEYHPFVSLPGTKHPFSK